MGSLVGLADGEIAGTRIEQCFSRKVRHHIPMRGNIRNDVHHTRCASRRRFTVAIVTSVVALLPAACAYKGLSMAAQTAASLHGDGALEAPAQTPNVGTASATTTRAETYNPALAPLGGHLQAKLTPSGESTNAEFTVSGLLPNRGYAVQANVNSCGGFPGAEGPHYQNRIDPAVTPAATGTAPSADPEYANPNNEIWLDVRTDATGAGSSRTTVPFVFTDRGPGSIVVGDAMQTGTGPGQAGKGGAPIACLTLSAVQPKGVEPRGTP
jgi:Cu-Zn family superoxide dismutase